MIFLQRLSFIFLFITLSACAKMYYSSMEKIGIPKREIMVHRVEKARDTQEKTKQQFKSALTQFTELTNFKGGKLEDTYKKLNSEYKDSVNQAADVRKKIDGIESVSEALFVEWKQELTQYKSAKLRQSSQQKLNQTKKHYQQLIAAMNRAESKIEPVLSIFKDQILYLKHNLNAQAITALKGELNTIEADVSVLIKAMEISINEANAFINTLEK